MTSTRYTLHRSTGSVARSIDHRSLVAVFFKRSLNSAAFSGFFYFSLVQIRRHIAPVNLLNTSFLEFYGGGEERGKIVAAAFETPLSKLRFDKTYCLPDFLGASKQLYKNR